MTSLHSLAAAGALLISVLPAFAQQTAAPAPTPTPTASMPMDCTKASMKRHDHGIERSGSTLAMMPCGPEAAASATAAQPKKTLRHDHAKFHKNQ